MKIKTADLSCWLHQDDEPALQGRQDPDVAPSGILDERP